MNEVGIIHLPHEHHGTKCERTDNRPAPKPHFAALTLVPPKVPYPSGRLSAGPGSSSSGRRDTLLPLPQPIRSVSATGERRESLMPVRAASTAGALPTLKTLAKPGQPLSGTNVAKQLAKGKSKEVPRKRTGGPSFNLSVTTDDEQPSTARSRPRSRSRSRGRSPSEWKLDGAALDQVVCGVISRSQNYLCMMTLGFRLRRKSRKKWRNGWQNWPKRYHRQLLNQYQHCHRCQHQRNIHAPRARVQAHLALGQLL